MDKNFFMISFRALASVLMAVLNISGIYEGFYDQFSKIRLNFTSMREINNLNSRIIAFLKEHGIELQLSIRESGVTGYFDVQFPREAVDSELEMKFKIPDKVIISLLKKLFVDILNLSSDDSITISVADNNSVFVDISANKEEQITLFSEDFRYLSMSLQTFCILRSEDDKFKFLITF